MVSNDVTIVSLLILWRSSGFYEQTFLNKADLAYSMEFIVSVVTVGEFNKEKRTIPIKYENITAYHYYLSS